MAGCQPKAAAPDMNGAAAEKSTCGMSAERLQRLDAHFNKLVDEGKIAGVVTWISRHGQVVHESAYGMADICALTTVDFAAFTGLEMPEGASALRDWHRRVSDRPSAAANS